MNSKYTPTVEMTYMYLIFWFLLKCYWNAYFKVTKLHYKCTMFMFYASIYVNAGVVLFSNKLKKKKKKKKTLAVDRRRQTLNQTNKRSK